MKHLIVSSAIGIAVVAAALFVLMRPELVLMRPEPPLTLEQYLDAAYCPTYDALWGEEGKEIASHYVNSWDYVLSRVQAAEPPPELRSFHENMLEGLPRASRAWEAMPEPINGSIDVSRWPEFEEFTEALRILQPENAGLDPDVEEALNVFCAPRMEEPSRMTEESQ